MEKYTGINVSLLDMRVHGYAQDGYQTILRFDTWKQKCTTHTKLKYERIKELEAYDSSISLEDLKTMIKQMEDNSINSANIDYCTDYDKDLYSLKLYISKQIELPYTDDDYLQSYANYVRDMHELNNKTYHDAVMAKMMAEQEYATYQRLREKFGE